MKSQVLKRFSQKLREKFTFVRRYFIFFVIFLLTLSLIRNISDIKRGQGEIEEGKAKVKELEKKREELKKKLEFVKSEEFVESQLRDKLGLSKEGEIVIVLPDDEILRKLAPKEEEEEEVLPDPNWKKWVKLFF